MTEVVIWGVIGLAVFAVVAMVVVAFLPTGQETKMDEAFRPRDDDSQADS